MRKIKIGIVGTGNIGTDLLLKIRKSECLECGIFAGRNPDSYGVKLAKELGVKTTFDSISYIEQNPDCCEVVFDATSAKVHEYNAPILKRLKKFTLDLTPAHIGLFCVPVVNLADAIEEDNVNLITCGGQATVPLACTIAKVHPDTKQFEGIAANFFSKSAVTVTRKSTDVYQQ